MSLHAFGHYETFFYAIIKLCVNWCASKCVERGQIQEISDEVMQG